MKTKTLRHCATGLSVKIVPSPDYSNKLGPLVPDAISAEDHVRREIKKCVADLMALGIRSKVAYGLLCRTYAEIIWNNAVLPSPLGGSSDGKIKFRMSRPCAKKKNRLISYQRGCREVNALFARCLKAQIKKGMA